MNGLNNQIYRLYTGPIDFTLSIMADMARKEMMFMKLRKWNLTYNVKWIDTKTEEVKEEQHGRVEKATWLGCFAWIVKHVPRNSDVRYRDSNGFKLTMPLKLVPTYIVVETRGTTGKTSVIGHFHIW